MKNINALDDWLAGLWHTSGGLDDRQFNIAVLELIRSNPGRILDSGQIREYILSKYNGVAEEGGGIWNTACQKAFLVTNISEFMVINNI
ncbi:hypothetical protein ACOMDM_13515 [Serratia plymuthica]|uniref:hypothetical protein n=1 Tax=Serratia TaxID=613 RepID=UPI003B9F2E7C